MSAQNVVGGHMGPPLHGKIPQTQTVFAVNKKSEKIRIDQLLVSQKLAPSRERAQAMVLAGKVLVNETRVEKPSERFIPQISVIRIKGPDHPYVGRGGVKLQGALDDFSLDPGGKTCLDVGASTGGFTDCLLQRGAHRVYTLDSGTNQLNFRMRQDPRVIARENFNVRFLTPEDLPERVQLIVVDVSFISLKLILGPLWNAVPGPWDLLMLVKPQFEAGKDLVEKGGLVRDEAVLRQILDDLIHFVKKLGLTFHQALPAKIKGEKGNQEYFIWVSRD